MSKITKSEKWFGKKKKDLTPEELKEFWRLDAQERRSDPEYSEYHKQYNKQYNAQYRKENKEKINQSIKEWKQNNPEKVKSYRYAKRNREIEVLKKALKETSDLMQNYLAKCLDLEAKLAEKETELQYCDSVRLNWKKRAETLVDLIIDLNDILPNKQEKDGLTFSKVIEDVKNLVAEKEKEIDNLYNRLNIKQKFYDMSLEKDYKEYLSRLDKLEKQCDKDKISFALEQLEKVKELVKENESWEIEGSDYSIVYADDVLDQIDNQIEELKKEMK